MYLSSRYLTINLIIPTPLPDINPDIFKEALNQVRINTYYLLSSASVFVSLSIETRIIKILKYEW